MKTSRIFFMIGLAGMLATALPSCEPSHYEPIPPSTDTQPWTATHSIAEFIAEFATETGTWFPVRPNSGKANLFSVDSIPQGGDSIIINGRVVSSDRDGNMYKYIVIQDLNDPTMGLKISVDANSLYGIMPIGQVISICCNGLAIGKYADVYQLGCIYFNNDSDTRKQGYEPGRIPWTAFQQRLKICGDPEPDKVVATPMTIAEIKAGGREVHSRLVVIKDAEFTGWGKNPFDPEELDEETAFWGRPKPSITGVPIAREITDPSGEKVYVSTSEFAAFANQPLPLGKVGDLTVVVSYYRDKERNEGDFQLNVRATSDFKEKN